MSPTKSITYLIIVLITVLGACTDNVSTVTTKSDIKPTPQQEKSIDRQISIVIKNMELDTQTANKFKPIYKTYKLEKFVENERVRRLVGDKDMETISDSDYKNFIVQSKKAKIKNHTLELAYVDRFMEILPIRKIGQLFLIEQKLQERLMANRRDDLQQDGGAGPQSPEAKAERQKKMIEIAKQKRKQQRK